MKSTRKLLVVFITAALLATLVTVPVSAAETPDALKLEIVGVLKGTGSGVDATYRASIPMRYQAAWLFLRLLGKETAAKAFTATANFTDAATARTSAGNTLTAENKTMLAYLNANQNLGFRGFADSTFRPFEQINAQQYYKLMLVALGYVEGTDFTWNNVFDKVVEYGLTTTKPSNAGTFSIDALGKATVEALQTDLKNGTMTLIDKLVDINKAISAYVASNAGLYGPTPEEYFTFASGEIKDYNTAGGKNVVIPAKIGGVDVTGIGKDAFINKSITSVTIPDSVTSIGESAFAANFLTGITIPGSVTSIGESAFAVNYLTGVTIPDSVTYIGKGAFIGLYEDQITLGTGVTGYLLMAGNSLTGHIGSPNPDFMITSKIGGVDVTIIDVDAFNWNTLTSVIIPDSVTIIGQSAFANNALISVTIPDSVTSIDYGAFFKNKLTSVTIPDSVTSIAEQAFQYNALASMTIGNSVTSIGWCAFDDNALTSVTLPDSVTSIGESAFRNNHLTSITIGQNVAVGDNLLANYNNNFKTAYTTGGAGTYTGTQVGVWTKQ